MAKKRSWKRWTAISLVGLAILTLIAFLALDAWARQRLERQVSLVEAQGGSLAYADYLPALEPGEPNASHGLSAARYVLASTPSNQEEAADWREIPVHHAAADPALVDRIRIWLERPENRVALEILDRHASIRDARPQDLPADSSHLYQQLAGEKAISSLRVKTVLRARAIASLADGRADDAYADAALLLRAANWIRAEVPSIITWLIGNAVARGGIDTVEELQQIAPPSSGSRELLREELARLGERPRSWGLEAERALSHERTLRLGLTAPHADARSLWTGLRRAFRLWQENAFHARGLAAYSELVRQANLPAYERPGIEALLGDDSPFAIPVKLLVPNLADSITKTDVLAMRCQLALVALAWEDYREAEGSYPRHPEALVPGYLEALPADAFTGRPLVWPPEEGARVVYSVGANQRDDGGVDRGTPQSGDEDDVVWRLPG